MSEKTEYHGMGFASILTIVFIVLKLTHNIDWSWWWVLSPLLIEGALIIIIVIIFLIISYFMGEN